MVKYCDIYKCEECPKYGDDCDGDKRNDDSISRADAIEAVRKELVCDGRHETHDKTCRFIADVILSALPSAEAEDRLYIKIYADDEPSVKAEKFYQICGETQNRETAEWLKEYFPSAEAKPTVIRSRTLMPTKDFKEWAKRVREENPNAVIIPCDAEVVSAEATCATCADRAVCIMSEPDGQWKACKNYRPSADDVSRKAKCCPIAETCMSIDCPVSSEYIGRPSAEAVQGEWGHMIADGKDGSHWHEYECSHCGEVVLRPYNFCPNCGAMMVREDGEV